MPQARLYASPGSSPADWRVVTLVGSLASELVCPWRIGYKFA